MKVLEHSQFNLFLNSKEEKEKFYKDYENSHKLRDVIKKIVLEKLNSSLLESEKKNYSTVSNWDLLQADLMGYRRALREIILLLDLPKEEQNDRFVSDRQDSSE